jgi:hypothetical protein
MDAQLPQRHLAVGVANLHGELDKTRGLKWLTEGSQPQGRYAMKMSFIYKAGLAVLVALASSFLTRADSLDVTLTESTESVTAGTTVAAFDATITNPSEDTVYLNSDFVTTDSLLVNVDDTPFLVNAPVSVGPGASSGLFEIFDVDLDPLLPPGSYHGVFTIYGGADGGAGTASDDLADANFTVDVVSPIVSTPEPATLPLLAMGLAALAFVRRRQSSTSLARWSTRIHALDSPRDRLNWHSDFVAQMRGRF